MALKPASVAAAMAALLAVAVVFLWWTHGIIPQLDGRVSLVGLRAPVTVRFDQFATPHISTQNADDAWFAVGYLQARDRAWQMELYRRAASGRLAEMLGDDLVPVDQQFLMLGLRKYAEAEWAGASPEVRASLERYSAGVNAAYRSFGSRRRPAEMQILGVTPEPWTPVDSLAIGKLFAWRLGENHRAELLRSQLSVELGAPALQLLGSMPEEAPQIVNPEKGQGATGEGQSADWPAGLAWLSDEPHAASNSWVIAGSRTATGKPLLANDPHLEIEMPSSWWEVHVTSPSLNVYGVTLPGIPFVLIGHNARIGWGVTNVGADVQDMYIEVLDPTRQKYLTGNGWRPLEVTHYEIRVRGSKKTVPFDVRATNHGPIANLDDWWEVRPGKRRQSAILNKQVFALQWDAPRFESAAAFEAMGRAANWTEFLAAVHRFAAPSQNFVYADVDGNIGYAMSGALPRRGIGDGSIPSDGSDERRDWQGQLDQAQLPTLFNPPAGAIVAANNEVDRSWPRQITADWIAPFRAERIEQMLAGASHLDRAAMEQMQTDITSAGAQYVLHALGDTVPKPLRGWNCRIDDSAAAEYYEFFEEALWVETFSDEMSDALFDRFYRYAANERFAGLYQIIGNENSRWFDDKRTAAIETRDDIVMRAARYAEVEMSARDATHVPWSRLHAVKFAHPLGSANGVFDRFFSRGPVPVDGDVTTVNKTTTDLRHPYGTSEAASYRQILDVGAWDRSEAVITTGESGHPTSPHYFDQNGLWAAGKYHPLPFTEQAVKAATASTLELLPKED